MHNLLIRLKVPIPVDYVIGAPALTFTRWRPLGDADEIVFDTENLRLKLWFDKDCIHHISDGEVEQHINVLAIQVKVDVEVKVIRPELLTYIRNRDCSQLPESSEQQLQEEYDDLAWAILELSLNTVNRMLNYVKSKWGQFWLLDYELDRRNLYSYFTKFKGKATTDGKQWFRFRPTAIVSSVIEWPQEKRFVNKDGWNEIREYVCTPTQRHSFVFSLLAIAEAFAANGQSRVAITEAYTALEIAIHNFARNPIANSAFAPALRERIGIDTLSEQVNRCGITKSISYLLPVIIPESVLPNSVLAGCREAIQQRQNIVHQGQREVKDVVLKKCLKDIRQMCEILESLTVSSQTDN